MADPNTGVRTGFHPHPPRLRGTARRRCGVCAPFLGGPGLV